MGVARGEQMVKTTNGRDLHQTMANRVLTIKHGDEIDQAETLAASLSAANEIARSVPEALERLKGSEYDAVVACFPIPEWTPAELLEEIQQTGDIFFPKRWLDATLGGHASVEAAEEVRRFLDETPDLPGRLRGKVLQSADMAWRAAEIVHGWEGR